MQETLFSYNAGCSIIHKMPAIIKLITLAIFCTLCWNSNTVILPLFYLLHDSKIFSTINNLYIIYYLFLIIVSIFAWVGSGARLNTIKKLKSVVIICILVIMIKIFNVLIGYGANGLKIFTALKSATIYSSAFMLSSFMAVIIFETTSFLQMYNALLLIPLLKKTQVPLVIALAISNTQDVFDTWQKICIAARARTPKKSTLKLVVLNECEKLSTLLSCMLHTAQTKRLALLNRL